MSVLARYVVDAPRPVPPLYTLIGSPATDASAPADDHWTAGLELVGWPTVDAMGVYPGCNAVSNPGQKATSGLWGPDQFDAVTILLGLSCSTISFPLSDLQARAEVAYAAYEHYPLERQVMAGEADQSIPHLADANAVIVGIAEMGIRSAVALLEDEIAATGRQGVIHCSPGAAAVGSAIGVFSRQGSSIVTINGTVVIPAQGYQGDTPDGESPAAGSEYMYASTPFIVRRGAILILDPQTSVDRSVNEAIIWVERDYAYAWDQSLQVAVNIDRTKE